MPNVRSLVEHRHRDTIAVLRHLLTLALRGDLLGISFCVRTRDGEKVGYTGLYVNDAEAAAKAAMRMSRRLNELQDELEELEHLGHG